MMVPRPAKGRDKIRHIGVEGHIGVGELMRKAIPQGGQSIVPANPVYRIRLLREHEGTHEREQGLPDLRTEPIRDGQLRNDEMLARERTPMGVGDGEIGNPGTSRAHGKRQTKVPDDGVGVQLGEQAQIVFDVVMQFFRAVQRVTRTQAVLKLLTADRSNRMESGRHGFEEMVIPPVAGEVDFVALGSRPRAKATARATWASVTASAINSMRGFFAGGRVSSRSVPHGEGGAGAMACRRRSSMPDAPSQSARSFPATIRVMAAMSRPL